MKIVTILGARPQFIKAATVSYEINKRSKIQEIIVHTGQHYDKNMSEVFFEQLNIPEPKYNLKISGLNHGAMTGRMIEAIEDVLLKENPNMVLLYGDTNSTLAGALAASKIKIPIAHVEAGLRSRNMNMPEEINRIITDRLSDLLFCPSENAMNNLKSEGFPNKLDQIRIQKLIRSGDVMYDVVKHNEMTIKNTEIKKNSNELIPYVLCTLHRQENTDDAGRMKSIIDALNLIAIDINVILPLHPRAKKNIKLMGLDLCNLNVIDPQPYLEMQRLAMGANTILTDSGGVQKEAFFYKIPCITLRDETEWVETIQSGWNQLAGADKDNILKAWKAEKNKLNDFNCAYGDGKASEIIVKELEDYMGCK